MIQELHPRVAAETVTIRPSQINDLEMELDFIRRLSRGEAFPISAA